MKQSRNDKPFRCIGLCTANAAGNEVTGTATGGFEEFVAAEGANIHFIDYHNGTLNQVIAGSDAKKSEDSEGHDGVITCILHDGQLVFTGSTDEKIICWDLPTRKMVREMVGHEGAIVSLAAEATFLVSSGADATLRLWNKSKGQQIRVIYGHSKSVLSMEVGVDWLVTGSTDEEVRLWGITKTKHSFAVDCSHRLIGHRCPVTVVRYGRLEIVSGAKIIYD